MAQELKKKFKIAGNEVELKLDDPVLLEIISWYEAASTAEYIMENYDVTQDVALDIGYKVRQRIRDEEYEEEEEDAVEFVFEEIAEQNPCSICKNYSKASACSYCTDGDMFSVEKED